MVTFIETEKFLHFFTSKNDCKNLQYTITIVKMIKGEIIVLEAVLKKAEDKGLTVLITQEPMKNRELSYWYGGTVATIRKDNMQLSLEATGDVSCVFIKKVNGKLERIECIDKEDSGKFTSCFGDEIKNDDELIQFIQHRKNQSDTYPQLLFFNRNTWKVFLDINGKPCLELGGRFIHISATLFKSNGDCIDTYTEALELVIEKFDYYVDSIQNIVSEFRMVQKELQEEVNQNQQTR